MHETRPFLITYHAMERYCERVHPALPLHQIRDLKKATNDAKIAMETAIQSAIVLDVRTNDGDEQRRIERPFPCVLICKEDEGAIVISTVLGPNETVYAGDEEIFEAYVRTAREDIERGLRNDLGNRRPRAAETVEDFIRRYVDGQIRSRLATTKDSIAAAVMAISAMERLAATSADAAYELNDLRRRCPHVFKVSQNLKRIAS